MNIKQRINYRLAYWLIYGFILVSQVYNENRSEKIVFMCTGAICFCLVRIEETINKLKKSDNAGTSDTE